MVNEYGVPLDRNGYAPSIAPHTEGCDLCRRRDRPLQRHEPFQGAFRTRSKNLGCWFWVCDECHRRIHQKDARFRLETKMLMQQLCMEHYGWTIEEFRANFGRNYLDGM